MKAHDPADIGLLETRERAVLEKFRVLLTDWTDDHLFDFLSAFWWKLRPEQRGSVRSDCTHLLASAISPSRQKRRDLIKLLAMDPEFLRDDEIWDWNPSLAVWERRTS